MMKTFGEMVAETQSYLRSFVRDQEISTHLIKDLSVDATTASVADAGVVSRGRIEIGDELIWVDKPVRNDNSLEIPPYGRGMDGTQANPHDAGSRVIVSPLYPRKFLKDTLNQTIRQIGSQLYGVEELRPIKIHLNGDFKYPMPEYVRDVLTITITDDRVVDSDVMYLRNWTFDKSAPLDVSETGKALYLYDDWCLTCSFTAVVSRDPLPLNNDSDYFSETMLPESAEDIPVLGAAARLLAMADAYDVQTRSIEANALDSRVSSTAAQQQSQYLQALYMQRLNEERLRLLNSTNSRARYQR